MAYLILISWLLILGLVYLRLPDYRIFTALAIGLSYTLWGIINHKIAKTLYFQVILEYLVISLLVTSVLIFISLRA